MCFRATRSFSPLLLLESVVSYTHQCLILHPCFLLISKLLETVIHLFSSSYVKCQEVNRCVPSLLQNEEVSATKEVYSIHESAVKYTQQLLEGFSDRVC